MRAPDTPRVQAAAGEGASPATALELASALAQVAQLVQDLRRRDEDIRRKDEDLRLKDAKVEELHAKLLSVATLAAEARFRNLERLRRANTVELRGALDVLLQSHALHGGSAKLFEELLSNSPLGTAALHCCNLDDRVVSDNGQPHSVATLAAELARIKRRLNKDSRSKKEPAQYRVKRDRLLLARDGLSDSDVVIVSCLLKAFGYPVEIVDDAQLADPGLVAAAEEEEAQD